MRAYARIVNGNVEEYALAFRGTNSFACWGQNVLQPIGLSRAMRESIHFANTFVENNSELEVTMIGHSKGGAEAAAAAIATNRNAITFNPASNDLAAYDLSRDGYPGTITVHIIRGDAIRIAFGWLWQPTATETNFYPGQSWSPIANHGIDALMSVW